MSSKACVLYCFLGDFVCSLSKDKKLRPEMSEKFLGAVRASNCDLVCSAMPVARSARLKFFWGSEVVKLPKIHYFSTSLCESAMHNKKSASECRQQGCRQQGCRHNKDVDKKDVDKKDVDKKDVDNKDVDNKGMSTTNMSTTNMSTTRMSTTRMCMMSETG